MQQFGDENTKEAMYAQLNSSANENNKDMQHLGMPQHNNVYFEQQRAGSNHCQVHAINNVFGACIVSLESMKNFIDI